MKKYTFARLVLRCLLPFFFFLMFSNSIAFSDALDYLVRKVAGGANCSVVLIPNSSRGALPSRLLLSVTTGQSYIRFSIDGDDGSLVEFVSQGLREKFDIFELNLGADISEASLWSQIVKSVELGEEFYLTRKRSAQGVSSSGYKFSSLDTLLQPLKYSCDFAGSKLIADSDDVLFKREKSLSLSYNEIMHIRVVLAMASGARIFDTSSTFSDSDRSALFDYTLAKSGSGNRYFSEGLVKDLLATKIKLIVPTDAELGRNVSKNGDWRVYEDNLTSRCEISTSASAVIGEAVYDAPLMRFAAIRSESDDSLWIDLVSPNYFLKNKKIQMLVDGDAFDLAFDPMNGSIGPKVIYGNTINREVLIAMRMGRAIDIVGTSFLTKKPLKIRFSAIGFEAALSDISKICGRPGLMKWIY